MAEASESAATEAPAEPATIEIWHPFRHRQVRRPSRPQRQGQPQGQGRFQRPAQIAPEAPAGTAAVASPDAAAAPSQNPRPRPEHRRRHNFEGIPNGAPRPDRKRDFSQKDAHRGPRNGDGQAKGKWSSAEKPRERQPDPNSPFAKLLELKQRMEEGKN